MIFNNKEFIVTLLAKIDSEFNRTKNVIIEFCSDHIEFIKNGNLFESVDFNDNTKLKFEPLYSNKIRLISDKNYIFEFPNSYYKNLFLMNIEMIKSHNAELLHNKEKVAIMNKEMMRFLSAIAYRCLENRNDSFEFKYRTYNYTQFFEAVYSGNTKQWIIGRIANADGSIPLKKDTEVFKLFPKGISYRIKHRVISDKIDNIGHYRHLKSEDDVFFSVSKDYCNSVFQNDNGKIIIGDEFSTEELKQAEAFKNELLEGEGNLIFKLKRAKNLKFEKTGSIYEYTNPDIIIGKNGFVNIYSTGEHIDEFRKYDMYPLKKEYQVLGLALAISEEHAKNIHHNERIVISLYYGNDLGNIGIKGVTLEYYNSITLKHNLSDNNSNASCLGEKTGFLFNRDEKYTLDSEYALLNPTIIDNNKWQNRVLEFFAFHGPKCIISNEIIDVYAFKATLNPWYQIEIEFWRDFLNDVYVIEFKTDQSSLNNTSNQLIVKTESELIECIQMIRYCNESRINSLNSCITEMHALANKIIHNTDINNILADYYNPMFTLLKNKILIHLGLESVYSFKKFFYGYIRGGLGHNDSHEWLRIFNYTPLSKIGENELIFLSKNKLSINDFYDKLIYAMSKKGIVERALVDSKDYIYDHLNELLEYLLSNYDVDKYNGSLLMGFLFMNYLVNNLYKQVKINFFPVKDVYTDHKWNLTDILYFFLSYNEVKTEKEAKIICPFLISSLFATETYNYCNDSVFFNLKNTYCFIEMCYSIINKYVEWQDDVKNKGILNCSYPFSDSYSGFYDLASEYVFDLDLKQEARTFERLNQNVESIFNDSSIKNAVYNLIKMLPVPFFYVDNYTSFRQYYLLGTFILEQYDFNSNLYVSNNTYYDDSVEEYIDKFSKILNKRYDIKEDCIKVATWCVLNYYVINYFTEKWLKISKIPFEQNKSIYKYIEECLENGCIHENDLESMNSLTYYLSPYANYIKWNDKFKIGAPMYFLYDTINKYCLRYKEKVIDDNFEKRLFNDEYTNDTSNTRTITISDVDKMTGQEFEELITKLFIKMGYDAFTTKASGDQGIDVIAEKDGIKYGIQAKCYSGSVGNAAVQEAAAGRLFYGCDKIIVVTNSKFTKSAIELAEYNSIILWNRDVLTTKFQTFPLELEE